MFPKLQAPLFNIEIPSTKNTAKIRPMLLREEKILLIAKESSDATDIFTAIKQVCGNCLTDADIDTLTLFDLEWIFMKIRAVSLSNIVKVSYRDSEDEKVYDFEIDLDKDVTMKRSEISNMVTFDNDNHHYEIALRYPKSTLYDDKGFLRTDHSHLFETIVHRCIDKVTIDKGVIEVPSFDDFSQWMEDLPLPVYNDIKQFFTNLPTLYTELNYKNSMGNDKKIVLSTLTDFFTL